MKTVLSSLNEALHAAMSDSPSVVFMGEDVLDPYGGAFKVSKGLSTAFPGRVFPTPISEAGIAAIATGMALRGYRPVAEVMFGDFLFLAADQLVNHAAKYRWMYGEKVTVPLVFRAPMGGRRGYGPTHSQTLEKHFLGVPGLWVVAPHELDEPGAVLRSAIDFDDPVLFVENKIAYSNPLAEAPDGFSVEKLSEPGSPFPTTWLKPNDGCDGVIFSYGGMVGPTLAAVETLRSREDISLGLCVPTQLSPTPVEALRKIITAANTDKFIYAEECSVQNGWASELIAEIEQQRTLMELDGFQHTRVGAANHPIPSSRQQETDALPQADDIVEAVLDCF